MAPTASSRGSIELELTETACCSQDGTMPLRLMQSLRMGVAIVLDDFGTGLCRRCPT